VKHPEVTGITVSYLVGRYAGRSVILRLGRFLHVTEARLDMARNWLERRGRWALVFGYFVPGIRHVTAIVAGASGLRWSAIAPFAYGGALLWSATFILAGYFLGDATPRVAPFLHRYLLTISVGLVTLLVAGILIRRGLCVKRRLRNNRPPHGP
jgi:membrane protein DedA with SNARE-associated domain